MEFLIGSDGRRVDLLPPVPVSQRTVDHLGRASEIDLSVLGSSFRGLERILGWTIWLFGLGLLLSGFGLSSTSAQVVLHLQLRKLRHSFRCLLSHARRGSAVEGPFPALRSS